jgi:hypothetical protein
MKEARHQMTSPAARAPTATPVNIVPYATLDPGIEFNFRGIERDADGEPIGELIDITLSIPPLNLANLRRLEKRFKSLQDSPTVATMYDLVELLIAALAQNYRGVPRWLIEQAISPGNYGDVATALMDVSGLRRKEIEEKKAMAARPPTGTDSSVT